MVADNLLLLLGVAAAVVVVVVVVDYDSFFEPHNREASHPILKSTVYF